MRVIKCASIPAAYEKGLRYVIDTGKVKHIHGTDVWQANEIALEIDVTNDILDTDIAPFGFESNKSYVENFLDPNKGDFTYTYGERICNFSGINQLDEVAKLLKKEQNSRQGVIVIWNPKTDLEMEDCPCMQHIQFYIDADDKFTMKVLFRSNDFYGALYSNMIALYGTFKVVANKVGLIPVKYVHDVNCPHIYMYNLAECKKKLNIK